MTWARGLSAIRREFRHSTTARHLIVLAALSLLGYVVLAWLSWQFTADVPKTERPTLGMLLLFAGEFVCYWAAIIVAVRRPPDRFLIPAVITYACLFRFVMLSSVPMHEIDIYRYMWDGAVLAEGVSPYRYSPQEVRDAAEVSRESIREPLARLVKMRDRSRSLNDSLNRIHYGQYTSPYPPVSQAVFAAAAWLTPESFDTHLRLVIVKGALVLCDLATLVVVIALLKTTGLHVGWSIVYGWCPLLLKEIANGGHLDSIAVLLSTLAVWLVVRGCAATSKRGTTTGVVAGGAMLALAVAAKIYPVVLLPLFASLWWRRGSFLHAVTGLVVTGLVSAVVL